jgi:hypothetical protein
MYHKVPSATARIPKPNTETMSGKSRSIRNFLEPLATTRHTFFDLRSKVSKSYKMRPRQ